MAKSVAKWAQGQASSHWPEHVLNDLTSLSSWATQRYLEKEAEKNRLYADIARLQSMDQADSVQGSGPGREIK